MTTEARLARRYESAATREFDKSLALLRKLQSNRTSTSTTAQIPTTTALPRHPPPLRRPRLHAPPQDLDALENDDFADLHPRGRSRVRRRMGRTRGPGSRLDPNSRR